MASSTPNRPGGASSLREPGVKQRGAASAEHREQEEILLREERANSLFGARGKFFLRTVSWGFARRPGSRPETNGHGRLSLNSG